MHSSIPRKQYDQRQQAAYVWPLWRVRSCDHAADSKILRQAHPRGFARNHNEAHAHCDTEWLAVLNPDIDFAGDPFTALLERARPDDGILAPVLVDRFGRASQDRGPISLLEIVRRRLPGWSAPPSPGWVPGAFMLIRSRAFQEIGGFDGAFRLYCEDADLCERMALAGYAIRRIPNVRVVHEGNRLSHRSARALMWHLQSLCRLLGKPSHQEFVRRWIRQQAAPNKTAARHGH